MAPMETHLTFIKLISKAAYIDLWITEEPLYSLVEHALPDWIASRPSLGVTL